jgi:small subunit ribosomal protein S8
MTDPIADMLNRIRNGIHARKNMVRMPTSKMKANIAVILKDEGYITDYSLEEDNKQNILVVKLRYLENGDSAIRSIKRVSTPGLRQYFTQDKIPWVMDGLGIFILSTNQGLLTDTQARRANVGGEGICMVW